MKEEVRTYLINIFKKVYSLSSVTFDSFFR